MKTGGGWYAVAPFCMEENMQIIKPVYFDDFATLYTDFEPVPFDNKTVVNAENAIVKNKSVIITSGNSSAKLLLPANVTSVVNRNSEWIETDTVSVGDEIMLVTHSPYGNIYDTESYKVCSADSRQSIATQSNGMSFVQGGYPWIPDENGTVKNDRKKAKKVLDNWHPHGYNKRVLFEPPV